MFTVKHKDNPAWTYVVYGVRNDGSGTRFLTWDGNVWRWEDANLFSPVDDNG